MLISLDQIYNIITLLTLATLSYSIHAQSVSSIIFHCKYTLSTPKLADRYGPCRFLFSDAAGAADQNI